MGDYAIDHEGGLGTLSCYFEKQEVRTASWSINWFFFGLSVNNVGNNIIANLGQYISTE